MEFSPMSTAVWLIMSGVIVNPQLEMTWAAFVAVVPITAEGEFMAKLMPVSTTQAAVSSMIATNDSISMPPNPISRMCDSFSTILGVVPEEISAWNPATEPQPWVMNRKGNSEPENTGPLPSMNRVVAGIASGGAT